MSWKKVIVIIVAIISIVVLYLLPTPNSKFREVTINNTKEEQTSNANLTSDEKVNKALEIIETGSAPPMQAIELLLSVIEEQPDNVQALYYLGDFSMKTGQFDKAIGRFEKLTKLEPKNDRFWYMLAQSYEMSGAKLKAVEAYKSFLQYGNDEIIINTVKDKIKELEN